MKKSCAYYSSLSSSVFLEVLLLGRSVAVDHDQVVAGLGPELLLFRCIHHAHQLVHRVLQADVVEGPRKHVCEVMQHELRVVGLLVTATDINIQESGCQYLAHAEEYPTLQLEPTFVEAVGQHFEEVPQQA